MVLKSWTLNLTLSPVDLSTMEGFKDHEKFPNTYPQHSSPMRTSSETSHHFHTSLVKHTLSLESRATDVGDISWALGKVEAPPSQPLKRVQSF